VAVTEPVPVTLPPRVREEEGRATGAGGGRETAADILATRASGLISTVWGTVGSVCGGSGAEAESPEFRAGTAVILSVFTSREDTLVTVPDCTVRPGDGSEPSAVCAVGVSTVVATGGASAPSELVLVRDTREKSEDTDWV
jgi:hypothetical protein